MTKLSWILWTTLLGHAVAATAPSGPLDTRLSVEGRIYSVNGSPSRYYATSKFTLARFQAAEGSRIFVAYGFAGFWDPGSTAYDPELIFRNHFISWYRPRIVEMTQGPESTWSAEFSDAEVFRSRGSGSEATLNTLQFFIVIEHPDGTLTTIPEGIRFEASHGQLAFPKDLGTPDRHWTVHLEEAAMGANLDIAVKPSGVELSSLRFPLRLRFNESNHCRDRFTSISR